ncbi:MAG: GNAT family N-acetyltransferase [Anaerolineae bacterium]
MTTPPPVTIRRAAAADAADIVRLNLAFNDLRSTEDTIAAQLAAGSPVETLYVAEVEGQVVGLASLRLLPQILDPVPYAELSELFVEEAYRHHGVGRALVRHIEAEARAAGAQQMVLLTAWRNTHAHAFYHALGYGLYTVTMRRALSSD